jgi:hypothetical protein
MFGIDDIVGAGLKIIDKVIPDPAAKDAAKLALLKAQQDGELEGVKAQLSAIVTEAQSADPWTSRARPAFLYVVYALILAAIPMGIVSAFSPDTAAAVTAGFKAWLAAIPESIVTLFGVGYLGYTGARSLDKRFSGAK